MAEICCHLDGLPLAIALAAVFNTVLPNTRERVRDTAILNTVGMGPGQTILMVATSLDGGKYHPLKPTGGRSIASLRLAQPMLHAET